MGTQSFVVINTDVNDSIGVDKKDCRSSPRGTPTLCKGDVGRMSFGNGHGLGSAHQRRAEVREAAAS